MAADELIKRNIPYSEDAERAVLGSMLLNYDAIITAIDTLGEDDFYNPTNKAMFSAIKEIFSEGKAVDIVVLQNALMARNVPEEYYSLEYLDLLTRTVPSSQEIEHYANIVAEKATLRQLIKATEEIQRDCYKGNDKLVQLLDTAERKIFEISQRKSTTHFEDMPLIMRRVVKNISSLSSNQNSITGIPSGLRELDSKTAGFQNSDFILLAARPAMGKTALALNFALNIALDSQKSVAFFSLEMSREQLANRLLAMNSGLNLKNMRSGGLKNSEWVQLVESAENVSKAKLMIDDTPGISLQDLRSRARKMKMDHGLDMIMIDYLQLMVFGKQKFESRQQEISAISRNLKELARELNVPVLALSQLSRDVEKRAKGGSGKDKTGNLDELKPMLSDLRDSGAIEQDADIVMFIFREAYYTKDRSKENEAQIIIAKHRNGPTGEVNVCWEGSKQRFSDAVKKKEGNNEV
ncbi:MAG: replicative DNA helicase [Lachnospiraceae bacterium]|nr:replicative DNA helicase [Lachnospiraceae bacterium]